MKEIKLRKRVRGLDISKTIRILKCIEKIEADRYVLEQSQLLKLIHSTLVKPSPYQDLVTIGDILNNSDRYIESWLKLLYSDTRNEYEHLIGPDSHYSLVLEALDIIKECYLKPGKDGKIPFKYESYCWNHILNNGNNSNLVVKESHILNELSIDTVILNVSTVNFIKTAELRVRGSFGDIHVKFNNSDNDLSSYDKLLFETVETDEVSIFYTKHTYGNNVIKLLDGVPADASSKEYLDNVFKVIGIVSR